MSPFSDDGKENKMKLKYRFESVDMGDEIVAVPVGDGAAQVSGVLKLNTEGREILSLLEKEISEEQLVDTLAAKYENDRDTLVNYVRAVLEKLRTANLLDE